MKTLLVQMTLILKGLIIIYKNFVRHAILRISLQNVNPGENLNIFPRKYLILMSQ